MNNLMWIILWVGGAVMLLYTLWLIVRLRNFSRSQDQTFVDNRLWEAMIADEALTPELKKALVKRSAEQHTGVEGGTDNEDEEIDDTESNSPDIPTDTSPEHDRKV